VRSRYLERVRDHSPKNEAQRTDSVRASSSGKLNRSAQGLANLRSQAPSDRRAVGGPPGSKIVRDARRK